ncbi:MAG: cupredoxin domain-containing protein [Acidimicrobiia bacterium]|nr:cupredoxin domain-containing protein [Acidimicrobiia bacterium]
MLTPFNFPLRRAAPLSVTLALGLVLAACGDTASSSHNSGGGTIAVVDGIAEIIADDLEFDAATITAPAGQPFTVAFTNMEGVPHNFSVYVEEGGELISEGDIINEGETDEVEVEGLAAGEYFFVCDLHSGEMTGTIVVEG